MQDERIDLKIEPKLGNLIGEVWADEANPHFLPSAAAVWRTAEPSAGCPQGPPPPPHLICNVSLCTHCWWLPRSIRNVPFCFCSIEYMLTASHLAGLGQTR